MILVLGESEANLEHQHHQSQDRGANTAVLQVFLSSRSRPFPTQDLFALRTGLSEPAQSQTAVCVIARSDELSMTRRCEFIQTRAPHSLFGF